MVNSKNNDEQPPAAKGLDTMTTTHKVGTKLSVSGVKPTTLAELLSPFAGNEAFYRRLIAIFEKNLSLQLLDIKQLAAQRNMSELLVLIHTLKGTAGTTGLASLHLALHDWERTLTELDTTTEATRCYANVGQHIADIAHAELAHIHALLATSVVDTPLAKTEQSTETLSLVQLTDELDVLHQHLLRGNLNAVDYCQALQAKLAVNSPLANDLTIDLTILCDTIEELNFDDALIRLSALAATIKSQG